MQVTAWRPLLKPSRFLGRVSLSFDLFGRLKFYRSLSTTHPRLRDPTTSPISPTRLSQFKTLVLTSTTHDPYENLAIESYLLSNSHPESCILFLYANNSCVVIGRNQNPWVECNIKKLQQGVKSFNGEISKEKVLLLRRRSGGGTVFHDRGNLNYAVIGPNDLSFSRKKYPEMVVQALTSLGLFDETCVNDRNDIVIRRRQLGQTNDYKVSGSAYKLTRGRALAHGTLLFASPNLKAISEFLKSPGKCFIKAKGVESVRSPVANLVDEKSIRDLDTEKRTKLQHDVETAIIETWKISHAGDTLHQGEVGSWDCQQDVNHEVSKGVEEFKSPEWKFGQTPGYEVSIRTKEEVDLSFSVKGGRVESVSTPSGSSMLELETVTRALHGRKVHEIYDWGEALGVSESLNEKQNLSTLIERLQMTFPKIDVGLRGRGGKLEHYGKGGAGVDAEVEIEGTSTVRELEPRRLSRDTI